MQIARDCLLAALCLTAILGSVLGFAELLAHLLT